MRVFSVFYYFLFIFFWVLTLKHFSSIEKIFLLLFFSFYCVFLSQESCFALSLIFYSFASDIIILVMICSMGSESEEKKSWGYLLVFLFGLSFLGLFTWSGVLTSFSYLLILSLFFVYLFLLFWVLLFLSSLLGRVFDRLL